ncbi:uracil-DNA glycosylase [Salinisphaera sp. W335]|uniref:Type-5 uracil-DNA glycosylase n=2 Tax=Spectribacter hydrogenoxidans TaxID=3075608 RepID=A0ABU3C252_9GAMM|nr:uracil-DNA glycosylase [Salinisphaera sp. W335]MDT0635634.1 uracil-DNA glycosylase [Salinisphaera sp. W335]
MRQPDDVMAVPAPDCPHCPRLVDLRREVASRHPEYHAAPVPAFGPANAELLIVGLAPGMHGANATGRPFTGDYAGVLLYRTLHDFGFADRPHSRHRDDGLTLLDCRITNAVKCLPPGNQPTGGEVSACNPFLAAELRAPRLLLALGGVAHRAVIRALGLRQKDWSFGHAAEHWLPDDRLLLDSYHCSRYNTHTRRLTEPMFRAVFARARAVLDS